MHKGNPLYNRVQNAGPQTHDKLCFDLHIDLTIQCFYIMKVKFCMASSKMLGLLYEKTFPIFRGQVGTNY